MTILTTLFGSSDPNDYSGSDFDRLYKAQARPHAGTALMAVAFGLIMYYLPSQAKWYFLAAVVTGGIGFSYMEPLWGWVSLVCFVATIVSTIRSVLSARPKVQQNVAKLGSNQPWTPEAEAWAAAYTAKQQRNEAQQRPHTKRTRTVTVANRPPEPPQSPTETRNDVPPPRTSLLILPRYSGPTRPARHGEDHGTFTVDDHRRFDPDTEE